MSSRIENTHQSIEVKYYKKTDFYYFSRSQSITFMTFIPS